ncbi:MAG: hypothetical protein LBH41_01030 [Rickettsiales bacterium]|jgi:hypothetical protein|nr:hypothetical protein [Rickettsiales bacterium]
MFFKTADEWIPLCMFIAGAVFAVEAAALYIFGRRRGKAKREHFYSRAAEIAGGAILMLMLGAARAAFFTSLDDVFSSMYAFATVSAAGIAVTSAAAAFLNEGTLKYCLLKSIDDISTSFSFVLAASVLGSQIPTSEMAKFFGPDMPRFALINLPFILSLAFAILSNLCMGVQFALARLSPAKAEIVGKFSTIILFPAASAWACTHFSLSFNIAGILAGGVLVGFILQDLPSYLGRAKQSGKPVGFLGGMVKILGACAIDIMFLCALVGVAAAWGGSYGFGLACIGASGGMLFKASPGAGAERSESFRHIARALNNMALFHIFCEALEFISNRRADIGIFQTDVAIGLFAAMFLIIANLRKIAMVSRCLLLEHKRRQAAGQTMLYAATIVIITAGVLPAASYGALAAFMLGTAILAPLVSLVLGTMAEGARERGGTFGMVVLMNSQIATFVLAATILLLPLARG